MPNSKKEPRALFFYKILGGGSISWRIVMIEQGEYLRLKLDNLFIQKGEKEYTLPLGDISVVIIGNLDTVVSGRLLDAFTSYNISVVVCDYKHQPSGIFTGLNTHSRASKVLQHQIEWSQEFKDFAWSLIVHAKILNQKNVMERYSDNQKNVELLDNYLYEVAPGDATNREGHAAKVYFNTLWGKDFSRKDEDDIRNICLNYGYSIIRSFFARLAVAHGYTGMIGVHHKSEYNNFNLVDDLMEPFRPIYDQYVLELLEEDSVFDFEMRYRLVGFLDYKIKYEGKRMHMINVIEKYFQSFIRFCRDENASKFIFPVINANE